MARFRKDYLDLARFAARMFSDTLFVSSPSGLFFKGLIPRFNGQDTVDLAVMETGNMANIDLPAAEKIVPKTLSPEFDKQWGLDAGRFREAHRLTRGRGVRMAILDTGIDMTHPVFKDTAWGRHFNFVGRDGFPWAQDGPPMVDWGWHGTVVSSIVAKYAPEARITLYRYLDGDSQNDSPFPIIVSANMGAAIYKAVHDGNDVINISAGTNIDVPYLEEACRYAWENNVVIVTGSAYYQGRYMGGAEDYPAQYATTIAATAIDRRADGSYGYWSIASPDPTTDVGAPNAPFVAFPAYSGETDVYAPGISCATPIVASVTALAVSVYPRLGTEAPGQYVETIRKLLSENANPKLVGFDGFSPEAGFGMVDAVKTVKAAQELGAARPVRELAAAEPARAPAASRDVDFAEGSGIFYKELKLALGLHPQRDRLLPGEIEKIEAGPEGLPLLYENLMNIVFWQPARQLLELRDQDVIAFREPYFALCRETADRFIESLFTESPATQALLQSPENRGRGRLDLVLLSLGMGSRSGSLLETLKGIDPSFLDRSRAMRARRVRRSAEPSRWPGHQGGHYRFRMLFRSRCPEGGDFRPRYRPLSRGWDLGAMGRGQSRPCGYGWPRQPPGRDRGLVRSRRGDPDVQDQRPAGPAVRVLAGARARSGPLPGGGRRLRYRDHGRGLRPRFSVPEGSLPVGLRAQRHHLRPQRARRAGIPRVPPLPSQPPTTRSSPWPAPTMTGGSGLRPWATVRSRQGDGRHGAGLRRSGPPALECLCRRRLRRTGRASFSGDPSDGEGASGPVCPAHRRDPEDVGRPEGPRLRHLRRQDRLRIPRCLENPWFGASDLCQEDESARRGVQETNGPEGPDGRGSRQT